MSKHAKDYLKLAAGGLLAATGIGALGVGPLAGLFGAGASGLGGAAGAAGATAAGEGALGMASAAPGVAGAFGPAAGSLGGSLLGAEAATPMMTQGLLGAGEGMGVGFGGPAGIEALASDPTANSSLLTRMQAAMGGSDFKNGMRGLQIANSMMPQQQPPQQVASAPPRPVMQQVPVASIGFPDQRRRGQFSASGLLGDYYG